MNHLNENTQSATNMGESSSREFVAHIMVPELLLSIMEQFNTMMDAERTTIFLYDEQEDVLWSALLSGEKLSKLSFPADQGIAGHVMQSGEVINIKDAYSDSRFNPEIDRKTGFKTRSILCVPLNDYDGKRIGVAQVLNKQAIDGGKPSVFSENDEKLLTALGTQTASVIENMQLREKEQQLSKKLEQSHRELQQAYVDIERNHKQLETRLDSRAWGRWAAIALLLAVVGGLLLWLNFDRLSIKQITNSINILPTQEQTSQDEYQEVLLEPTTVADWLSLNGRVQPLEWIEISSPINSSIKAMHFGYGKRVRQGQLLAQLDTRQHQLQLRMANTDYISALSNKERISNWSSSREVLAAKRELNKAKESARNDERKFKQTERLFSKGIISRSELESSQTSLNESKTRVLSAQDNLQSILEQGNKQKLRIATLKLDNAKQRLDEVKADIANADILSPANGIIFSGVQEQQAKKDKNKIANVGAKVTANSPLFAIANFQGIAIESDVIESDILKLAHGQPALVSFDALPGLSLAGSIDYIAGRASAKNRDQLSSFKVRVVVPQIAEADAKLLRIGMTAVAKIRVYFDQSAVVVPFDSIIIEGQQHFIMVKTKQGPEKRQVVLKATRVNGVEIAQGLALGESILIAAPSMQKRPN